MKELRLAPTTQLLDAHPRRTVTSNTGFAKTFIPDF
jgi:hypothetical protein